MKTLLAKKTVLVYIAVYMVLFLTAIVNDACGVGNPLTCTPCQKWDWGLYYGTWGWACFDKCAYPLLCCNGTCYYPVVDCKYCATDNTLKSNCDPNGHCCGYGGYCCPNGQECCGTEGACADPKKCQKCVNGEVRGKCDSYLCEDCNNGFCEICGGDTNMKCCSPVWPGVCREKCKLVDGESCIMDAKIGCTGTCVYGGSCSIDSQKVYSGVTEKTCNPKGCMGDCSEDTTWCYKTYNCVPSTTYIWLSQCTFTPSGPGGDPVTLDHTVCEVLTFSAKCYLCTKDTIPVGEPTNVEYDSCN